MEKDKKNLEQRLMINTFMKLERQSKKSDSIMEWEYRTVNANEILEMYCNGMYATYLQQIIKDAKLTKAKLKKVEILCFAKTKMHDGEAMEILHVGVVKDWLID